MASLKFEVDMAFRRALQVLRATGNKLDLLVCNADALMIAVLFHLGGAVVREAAGDLEVPARGLMLELKVLEMPLLLALGESI